MAATLTVVDAAAYLGMSVQQFRRAVSRGEMPKPLVCCRPNRWSKIQIDWALEGRLDKAASSVAADPIMDALDALPHAIRSRA